MINKSLSALGNVINALSVGKPHIPYRDSKLTRVLQDCLGGNSKTSLVVTCSPSAYNVPETISTIRFGQRAKKVVCKARVNREESIDEYKKQLSAAEKKERELMTFVKALCFQLRKLKIFVEEKVEANLLEMSEDVRSDLIGGMIWGSVDMILQGEEEGERGGEVEGEVEGEGEGEGEGEKMFDDDIGGDSSSVEGNRNCENRGGGYGSDGNNANDSVNDSSSLLVTPPPKDKLNYNSNTPVTPRSNMISNLQEALEISITELTNTSEELSEAQSEIEILKENRELENEKYKEQENQLKGLKMELQLVKNEMNQVRQECKNAEYREKESNMFLRQFKKEYKRLQQQISNKSGGEGRGKEGEGEGEDFTVVMKQAGLLGDDDEEEEDEKATGEEKGTGTTVAVTTPDTKMATRDAATTGNNATGNSDTPVSQREISLIADLGDMTRRFVELRLELEEERQNVEMLSDKVGSGRGSSKKKDLVTEVLALKKALDRRSNDVQTALLKGQELHMQKNMLTRKLANREQHVRYLEDSLKDLQDAHRNTIIDNHRTMESVFLENTKLKKLVSGFTMSDSGVRGNRISPDKNKRVVKPIRGTGGEGLRHKKKLSFSSRETETFVDVDVDVDDDVEAEAEAEKKGVEDTTKAKEEDESRGNGGDAEDLWSPLGKGAVPILTGNLSLEPEQEGRERVVTEGVLDDSDESDSDESNEIPENLEKIIEARRKKNQISIEKDESYDEARKSCGDIEYAQAVAIAIQYTKDQKIRSAEKSKEKSKRKKGGTGSVATRLRRLSSATAKGVNKIKRVTSSSISSVNEKDKDDNNEPYLFR